MNRKSAAISATLHLLLFSSMALAANETPTDNAESKPDTALSTTPSPSARLRRAPATTAPSGFFGDFMFQALCLSILSGGFGGGGAAGGPLQNNNALLLGLMSGGFGGGGGGGGFGGLNPFFGRRRRGAGPRGNRPPSRRPISFNRFPSSPFGGGAQSILSRYGISRFQSPQQLLNNRNVAAIISSNPRTRQQLNSAMANQAVGGGGGGGGISTDQIISIFLQAMCLQQQSLSATALPAALRAPRPRPGRG